MLHSNIGRCPVTMHFTSRSPLALHLIPGPQPDDILALPLSGPVLRHSLRRVLPVLLANQVVFPLCGAVEPHLAVRTVYGTFAEILNFKLKSEVWAAGRASLRMPHPN